MTKQRLVPDPSWRYRRRAVGATLLLSFALLGLSMIVGVEMTRTVVGPLTSLIGAALAFYVGGAAWERTSGIPSQARYEDVKTN